MAGTSFRRSRRCGLYLAYSTIVALQSSPTFAQVTEPQEPGTGLPEMPPALPEKPPAKYDFQHNVTGDWFGLRNWLSDQGIEISGGYALEYLGNPVGGKNQGSTYVHNILLQTDLNLEKLIGLPKSAFRARFSQRSGDSLTNDHVGNTFSVQQLYGGGQTYRLVEMQVYHSLFDDRLNLTYGRLAATDDFLTSPLYCQFVNNAFCGQPPTPFFNMPDGITAYPGATWGVRGRYTFPFESYAMVGVYDGDPEQEGRNDHGTNFSFGDNGVLVLTEIGYTPQEGLLDLPGHYKLGGFYHSGNFRNVAKDVNGNNRFATGLAGNQFSGNSGFYILLDQMMYREKAEADEGLYGFGVFVLSPDQQENTFPYFYSLGLVYQGLLDFRPQDKTALGVTTGWFSDKLGDAQHDAGLERQTAETVVELNHQIQLTPAIYVRPDIQYVIRPSGRRDIDNALVVGFEAGVTF
jgi:porin